MNITGLFLNVYSTANVCSKFMNYQFCLKNNRRPTIGQQWHSKHSNDECGTFVVWHKHDTMFVEMCVRPCKHGAGKTAVASPNTERANQKRWTCKQANWCNRKYRVLSFTVRDEVVHQLFTQPLFTFSMGSNNKLTRRLLCIFISCIRQLYSFCRRVEQ